VEEVIFPLDPSFSQYELARKQMKGACGLMTMVIKAKKMEEIVTFCESLRHILMAVSWGGHESLVIPKCASLLPKDFDENNREHKMVRLYVGLEDPEYLIQDLEQALVKMK
jgi:cystathionine beta-lyase/cystathionine gamma-synthase